MRQDLIGPRRLKPARREDESSPFVLVRELDNRVLKGIVEPSIIRGATNGVLPTMKVFKNAQPRLIMKAAPKSVGLDDDSGSPSDKVPGLISGAPKTPKAAPKGGGISVEGVGHSSQKVPGLEHHIGQSRSEYKNPDASVSAGERSSKPTPKSSPEPSYKNPNISVGADVSSKPTKAPPHMPSYQPPAGKVSISLDDDTKKSLLIINSIISSLKK